MRPYACRRGFTLVEIMIVVVILAILAVITIPQFSSASQEAIKSTLRRQLQTVNEQVEVYRVQHAGQLPTADATAPFGGGGGSSWGVMINGQYLREAPVNQYTGGDVLGPGTTEASAAAAPLGHAVGWQWAVVGTRLDVWASGYDRAANRLSNEP